MRHLIAALLLLSTVDAFAQSHFQPPYERVLIPIVISEPVPGAYGSMWTTQLVARSEAGEPFDLTTLPQGICTECPLSAPHATFSLPLFVHNPNGGAFIYVGSPGIGKVTFTLRVQDISRQAQTWGTTIPTVRERDVYTRTLHLLDIPVDSHFRSALRIYDFDAPLAGAAPVVRVRVYDMCGVGPIDSNCADTPLVDSAFTLGPVSDRSTDYPVVPASVMIGNLVDAFSQLASVPPTQLAGATRPATVRIDIDPITPGLRFWAFVSVTNNETQHVTAIVPQ